VTPADRLLWKKYGLTRGQYDMLLRIQNGVCALCRRPPKNIRLHVDHDHRTGAVRGLLCHRCNRGLGYIQNPVVLLAAAEYVLGHTGYFVPKSRRKRAARANLVADELAKVLT
jgi:hypothetical protein